MFGKLTERRVMDALATVSNPSAGTDLVASGVVEGVAIREGEVTVILVIEPARRAAMEVAAEEAQHAIARLRGVKSVRVALTAHREQAAQPSPKPPTKTPAAKSAPPTPSPLPNVAQIVAIASGKGGVGKSTTASNLAVALAQQGLRAGLLDADIFGPSIPRMLGAQGRPELEDGNVIVPIRAHGIETISMGHLIPEERAAIWRGPKLIGALRQLLTGVSWGRDGGLDVLVVDLPPGTGDVQLSLSQTVPLAGAVLVSTPQDIALIDAKKAYDMFAQTGTPVLGMIENMSQFVCPHCGESSDIFGHGGAVAAAREKGIEVLGQVPLDPAIMQQAEAGMPIVLAAHDSKPAATYRAIASRIAEQLELEHPGS